MTAVTSGPGAGRPAEERVYGGLGQPLARDHPLALMVVFARAGERGQHRLLGLLQLQEQRLVGAVAEQQHDERLGADRPDTDHLAREVAEVVTLQHRPPLRLQPVQVLLDSAAQFLQDVRVALNGEADDNGMSGPDPVLSLDLVAHLQEGAQAGAAVRLRNVPVAAAYCLLRLDRVEQPAYLVDIDPGIPDLEEPHCRVLRHLGAVAARCLSRGGARVVVAEAIVPRGDGDAGRKSLDVPVERRRERLVEVVDVEDQVPVGRRVHAEVQQVRVTAGLYPDIGAGRVREIPGHRRRRAAEVGERRGGHAPVADRYQIRHPGLGLLLENGDRVGPFRRRRPLRVAGPGHGCAVRSAPGPPLVRREHLMRRRQDTRTHLAHQVPHLQSWPLPADGAGGGSCRAHGRGHLGTPQLYEEAHIAHSAETSGQWLHERQGKDRGSR